MANKLHAAIWVATNRSEKYDITNAKLKLTWLVSMEATYELCVPKASSIYNPDLLPYMVPNDNIETVCRLLVFTTKVHKGFIYQRKETC